MRKPNMENNILCFKLYFYQDTIIHWDFFNLLG